MRCPYCNYELTDDAIYCDNCDNLINGAVPNKAVPNTAVPTQDKAPGFLNHIYLCGKIMPNSAAEQGDENAGLLCYAV